MTSRETDTLPGKASDAGKPAIEIEFAGLALTLDHSGAAYAGGLSCRSRAIRSLLKSEPRLFMLHASKLWRGDARHLNE